MKAQVFCWFYCAAIFCSVSAKNNKELAKSTQCKVLNFKTVAISGVSMDFVAFSHNGKNLDLMNYPLF